MQNICRICETRDNLINLISKEHARVVDMLKDIAKIRFSIDDKLPKTICQLCRQNIQSAFKFISQIESTDLKLRKLLNDDLIIDQDDEQNFEDIEFKIIDEDDVDVKDIKSELDFEEAEDVLTNDENAILKDESDDLKIDKIERKKKYRRYSLPVSKLRELECYLCKQAYARWKSLVDHFERLHLDVGRHSCKICSKKYYSRHNLQRHINEIHKQLRPYNCKMCGKTFAQKSSCTDHELSHNAGRQFKCNLCDKHYKTPSNVRLHYYYVHRPQRPNVKKATNSAAKTSKISKSRPCEYCGKQIKVGAYKVHLRTHTGETPYKCDICDRRFKQMGTLYTHARTHTDEKPHACTMCDLKFREKTHLRTHTLVHTGEKAHKCNYCGKLFALKGNLTCHIRQHTGETPYHCTVCPDKFFDLNGLKRHRKVHHQ